MNMAEPLQFTALRDEPMARHVSWRAGGKADRFFAPNDLDHLASFLEKISPQEQMLFVGLGSNLLVRDGGFRGTVVLMHSAELHAEMRDGRLYAQCTSSPARSFSPGFREPSAARSP